MLHEAVDEGLFSDRVKGRRFAFTGTTSMVREDLKTLVRIAGGVADERPVRGTHYLVVGDTGAHGRTQKMRDAEALGITVLSEPEFAQLLTVVDLPDTIPV